MPATNAAGTIALTLTAAFLATNLLAPRHGVPARLTSGRHWAAR